MEPIYLHPRNGAQFDRRKEPIRNHRLDRVYQAHRYLQKIAMFKIDAQMESRCIVLAAGILRGDYNAT